VLSNRNITRTAEHLLNLKCGFLSSPAALACKDEAVVRRAEEVQARNAALAAVGSAAGGHAATGLSSTGQRLKRKGGFMDFMTAAEQQAMKQQFAEMLYVTNLPFSWAEQPIVKDFFKALRPSFELPTRYQLSNTYLFEAYNQVARRVMAALAAGSYITLTTDGWSRWGNLVCMQEADLQKWQAVFLAFKKKLTISFSYCPCFAGPRGKSTF
jgi:hypothetical protein